MTVNNPNNSVTNYSFLSLKIIISESCLKYLEKLIAAKLCFVEVLLEDKHINICGVLSLCVLGAVTVTEATQARETLKMLKKIQINRLPSCNLELGCLLHLLEVDHELVYQDSPACNTTNPLYSYRLSCAGKGDPLGWPLGCRWYRNDPVLSKNCACKNSPRP